jgi:UV DNA damage endonuclease
MNFGYACINMTLGESGVTTNRTMIKKTFIEKGETYASQLALLNCRDLLKILEWNAKNNIKFFRLTSNLFPWASEYDISLLPDFKQISSVLKECGEFAKKNEIRITSHPGPFNKLCSPNESVVLNTIKDLEIHGVVFDLIGLPKNHWSKINIHVGAAYGNKPDTVKTFCKNFSRLSGSVSTRFTLENDDKETLFSTKELFEMVYQETGIPIVHDQHHHKFCNGGLTQEEAMNIAFSTWPKEIRPVIHYSESKSDEDKNPKIKPQAHSDYVYSKIETFGLDVDIMVEAKAKELALKKYFETHNIY